MSLKKDGWLRASFAKKRSRCVTDVSSGSCVSLRIVVRLHARVVNMADRQFQQSLAGAVADRGVTAPAPAPAPHPVSRPVAAPDMSLEVSLVILSQRSRFRSKSCLP